MANKWMRKMGIGMSVIMTVSRLSGMAALAASGDDIDASEEYEGYEEIEEIEVDETVVETDTEAEEEDIEINVAADSSLTVPDLSSEVNVTNALAILDEYDPEGSYIVHSMIDKGEDIGFWLDGEKSNARALDTAVHEEFHSYTFRMAGGWKMAIYIGDDENINVEYTDLCKTEEWAANLPESLRTFRYDTYVSAGSSPDSNTRGVYGLLNEFAAYSWGMNNAICLYPYYEAHPFTFDTWNGFINSCENNYQAFCEFRFYTLGYLDYLQNAHPEMWNDVMNNQNYINAYCVTEKRFENLIAEYLAKKEDLIKQGAVEHGKYIYFGNTGTVLFDSAREVLLEQIESPELQAQEQLLFSKCDHSLPGEKKPTEGVTPEQSIPSLEDYADGVIFSDDPYHIVKAETDGKGNLLSAAVYLEDGKTIDTSVNSLLRNIKITGKDGKVYTYTLVFTNGSWDTSYDSGINGAYEYMGESYFVAGGVVNANANGLIFTGADGWKFLAAGRIVTDHAGLVMYNGEWFWIDDLGSCDDTYAAIVAWNGANFLVHGGRLRTDYTGFTYDPQNTGKWYHITGGQVWGDGVITDKSIEGGVITRKCVNGVVIQ
ncbi:MAG: hypothetical protein J6O73_08370 [Lachnospiraceae bacterium]|nr:hypothetical protein [Lachnospiraceae bacterium]